MMELVIDTRGQVRCIYAEQIDLAALGRLTIRRASYVEPDGEGGWAAELAPVDGPCLEGFDRRSEALEAERAWLEDKWLIQAHDTPTPGPDRGANNLPSRGADSNFSFDARGIAADESAMEPNVNRQ